MSTTTRDPLLIAAKVILWIMLGLIAFAGFFVTLGVPAVLIFGDAASANVASGELDFGSRALIALLLAGVAGLLWLGWRFFRNMLAIVHSVGDGDPFEPANGDRLTSMAWIALVSMIAVPVIGGFGIYIASTLGEEPGTMDGGIEGSGIILILTLFILARVFRHGAAMREDLEGTV